MPQLVADLGHSSAFATLTAATAALAGVVVSLLMGVFGTSVPLRAIAILCMAGLTATTAVFGLGAFDKVALLALAAVLGAFLYPGTVALYGTIVDTFAPAIRATGVGFAMGMGRVSGAITPALAGQLFALGMGRSSVSVLLSLCASAAAVLMVVNGRLAAR